MRKKLLFTTIFFVLSFSLANADDDLLQIPTSIGVYSGLHLNVNMQFPAFINHQQNMKFWEQGKVLRINFGLIGLFPINESLLFSARIGYNSFDGHYEGAKQVSEFGWDIYDLDAQLNYIEVSPTLHLLILKNLYLLTGVEFGIPLSPKYSGGYTPMHFEDNSYKKLPDANTRYAGILGLGYMFPLGKTIYLTPEASCRLSFSNVTKNSSFETWKISQVRVGLALTYGLSSQKAK